jgi:Domain of unknown function (DUF4340)
MNSKGTFTWIVIAVALLAFIFGYHFFERPPLPPSLDILPGLRLHDVTMVQVIPNNSPEICAVNQDGNWVLTQPVAYPAQATAIEAFLEALQKLKAAVRISPAELSQNHDANAQYGFDSPSVSIVIQSGDQRHEILVGHETAPGDQVFLRVAGLDGVYVTDAAWLKFIPQSVNNWRDTSLVGNDNGCDTILLTNGAQIIQLYCDPINHLWQMVRPLTARANGDYIAAALQKLQTARVSQFVTDNSNADLSAFGLQPADMDVWLENGSNVLTALHVGKASTNDLTQVFAKRERWNTIVTTARQPLLPWYGKINDFRDPYLFELTVPAAEIEIVGPGTNHIFLQRQGATGWQIPGQTFPADPDVVQSLIQTLASLRVSEFAKDIATPADLPAYGLAPPSRQIILRSAIDDTNAVIAQLLFGAVRTNEVFVQRAGENAIYAITPEDFSALPNAPAWAFRDRRIWSFGETNIAQITVRQNGKIVQMVRNGPNQWSLAAGSQGVINPPAIEEIAHDLGQLASWAWMAHGPTDPPGFGLKADNLSITVTLKDGQSDSVEFGAPVSGQTSYAAVTLDGERWVFIFSPALYQLVQTYLAAPLNVP